MVQVVEDGQTARRATREDDVRGVVHAQGGGDVRDERIKVVPAPQPEITRLAALLGDGNRVRSPAAETGAVAIVHEHFVPGKKVGVDRRV